MEYELSVMKLLLCGWLFSYWTYIHNRKMVQIGWERCGLLQAFEPEFESQALNKNMMTPLFKDKVPERI